MTNDNRMYFVRNMKEILDSENYSETEYEVAADSYIVGEIYYGPYYFTIWDIGYQQPGDETRLCLRVREQNTSDEDKPWKSATKGGFYHGGGIVDEISILSSLFLRRRIKAGPIVRMDNLPRYLIKNKTWLDKDLVENQSNLSDLKEWFDLVQKLPSEYHQKFILAAKLYNRAIQIIEDQPDLAYLNFISAIEVLCRDTDIGIIKLSDLENKEIEFFVNQINDEELKQKLENAILNKEHFIGRKFVAFILNNINNEFWAQSSCPEYGKIKKDELPNLLKRVYRQRSKTLHEGEPFPPQIFNPPYDGVEIDTSLAITVGHRKWEPKEYIPNVHYFEKLINHVLKNYLKNKCK